MMFSYVAMVTKKATPQGAITHPICKRSSNLTRACKMKGIDLFCSRKIIRGDKPKKIELFN